MTLLEELKQMDIDLIKSTGYTFKQLQLEKVSKGRQKLVKKNDKNRETYNSKRM